MVLLKPLYAALRFAAPDTAVWDGDDSLAVTSARINGSESRRVYVYTRE